MKYDFEYTFDVSNFEAMKDVHVAHQRRGHKQYKEGLYVIEKVQQEEGYVHPKFKQSHKLTTSTTPKDYADIFLPFSRNMQGSKYMIIFEQMMKWKKLKAVLYGAGQGVTYHHYFRTFTVRELRQNFGHYIFCRIIPLPRVEIEFKPQRVDYVNGNDFFK